MRQLFIRDQMTRKITIIGHHSAPTITKAHTAYSAKRCPEITKCKTSQTRKLI